MSQSNNNVDAGSDGSNPQGSTPESTLQELHARLDALSTKIDYEQQERRDLRDQVQELQEKLDQANDEIATRVERRLEKDLNERLRNEQIERTKMLSTQKAKLMDEIDDVRDELRSEQKTRTAADSQTRQRISHLADELDVTIDEADLMNGDKLVRAIRNGAHDVTSNPNKREQRARDLLVMLDDWKSGFPKDSNGRRVIVKAKDLKPPMGERYGVTMSTRMVTRAFEVLEEWAEDSPRRVRMDKNQDGEWRLTIWQPDQLLEAAEEVSS